MTQSSDGIPKPTEWLLVSTRDSDASTGTVDSDDVQAAMSHGFHCSTWSRVHVFWRGLKNDPTVHHRENR